MPTATAKRIRTAGLGTARLSSTGELGPPSYTAAPTVGIVMLRPTSFYLLRHALDDPEVNNEYVLMDPTKKIWCHWPAFG